MINKLKKNIKFIIFLNILLMEKNDNKINDNIAIDELKQTKNENTFQRLINLQKLIKKESALKELSKKNNLVNKV